MPVYFDHNATAPLDPRVLEAMLPYLADAAYGNPSSVHRYGRAARQALDTARAQVAALVGAEVAQLTFTSGGTEANNLALKGYAARHPGRRLLVSAIEHACIVEPAQALARQGVPVEWIPADARGQLDQAALEALLAQGNVGLVAVMYANNETGVVQDIPAIAARVRAAGGVLHCDAVQAAGKLPLDFRACGAHSLTLSAHKIYGPRGWSRCCTAAARKRACAAAPKTSPRLSASARRPSSPLRSWPSAPRTRARCASGWRPACARCRAWSSSATAPSGCRTPCSSARRASRARPC
jgi:cysteine desulfurase